MKLSNWIVTEIQKGNIDLEDLSRSELRSYRRIQRRANRTNARGPLQALLTLILLTF